MSLADRLAQAQAVREPQVAAAPTTTNPDGQRKKTTLSTADPFADLKRTVHQRLVSSMGPKLYDANKSQTELEQQVRATLQGVMATEDTPLTMADRVRITQEIADDILGYGPIEPFLRDP